MPRRSNEFQDLVSLVQKALVPSGAIVSDSALVDVSGMSEPREIDVLIENAIGPYHIKIAVEARDHRRKLDSTQFESLIGKYFVEGGVKVDKVVIVTHNGFYKPVIDRAKRLGVELLTLSEAKDVDWAKFRPQLKPFKTAPRICDIKLHPPVNVIPFEKVVREGKVTCSHGTDFGNLEQFATHILVNNVLKNQEEILRQLDDAAALAPDGKKGKVEYKPDHPHTISLSDEEFPVEKLNFAVHFSKAHVPQIATENHFQFQFAPHVCKLKIEPSISEGTIVEIRSEGRLVCTCCGKDHGTLNKWSNKAVFEGVFQRSPEIVKQFQEGLRKSPSGEAWLNLDWKFDEPKKVIRFRGSDFPVSSISVAVHAVSARAPLVCKHYELAKSDGEEKILSHLEATAGGKKFSIVIPHSEDGPPDKIVLNVADAKPSSSSHGETLDSDSTNQRD